MTTFINVLTINAANSLQRDWPRMPKMTGGGFAAFRALLSGNCGVRRSELNKSDTLGSLEKVFARVCRRWVMSQREGFHYVRSH